MQRFLDTSHGRVPLPAFFPDGTAGVVRGVDAEALAAVGTPGVVMNTYHLMQHPGADLVASQGGLHRFTGWERAVLTDSGGFQVLSLGEARPGQVTVRPDGVLFRPRPGKKLLLGPERVIATQFRLGADIMMCLDHCTHPEAGPETQRQAVRNTVNWARAGRAEFERRAEKSSSRRPLLFAIIQGGADEGLRRECAERLVELGFDGFGFGGWPLDRRGTLLCDLLEYTCGLMPAALPRYAMGIGRPDSVVACACMGYDLFDSVLPTREGRRGRLYVFTGAGLDSPDFYATMDMTGERYARDPRPVSESCDCPACRRFSRAYLHHLFQLGDSLAARLGTLHNLRFYAGLMARLGATGGEKE